MDEMEQILRQTFLDEASQLLQDAEQSFLALENGPDDPALINQIFRLAHNLKGSAKAVHFDELGAFMHELESLLLKIKDKVLAVDTNIVNLFLRCNDLLIEWIQTLRGNQSGTVKFQALLAEIVASCGQKKPPVETGGFHSFGDEEPVEKVVMRRETEAPTQARTEAPKDESLRVSLQRVDGLVNDVGELVILQTVLKQQKHLIESPLLQKTIDQLAKITRNIQETSMRLRMVPIQTTFHKMQRILRDTSKSLGKEVRLHLLGEETELDKTVVDKLGDPLVHLIRNAVDHGLENPEERRLAGKSPEANVWLSAQHQGGRMLIEVRDDGRGLDAKRIRQKAEEKGVIAPGVELTEAETYELIFSPGFSTKAVVTEVSGRGVGLDVVKTNIAQLKGEIQLTTVLGQGTSFRIFLPLTLAIIDGIVIRLNEDERYVVPLAQVHEIIELSGEQALAMGRTAKVFELRGKTIPLYSLGTVLNRPFNKQQKRGVVIVLQFEHREYGFLTEAVVSQQQVVIKQLGRDIRKIIGISGSAILGDGKAALILDLEEIAKGRSA